MNRNTLFSHFTRLTIGVSLLTLTAIPSFAQDEPAIDDPAALAAQTTDITVDANAIDATTLDVNTLDAAQLQSEIINPGAPVIYTVQPGDTLNKIARAFGMTWQQLAALNNIVNPNLIYIGQRIYIQKGTGNPGNPGNPGPITGDTYVVQQGDTLARIAARAGTTVSTLVKLNKLADANKIYVGQRLIVKGVVVDPIPATYVVQQGDTLYKISVKFYTTVDALAKLNNLTDINRIYAGQVLKIA